MGWIQLPNIETNQHLEDTTVRDSDSLGGAAITASDLLDVRDNIHTLGDLTKDNVLAIQPRGLDSSDKELRTVGVWTSVGHREQTWGSVLEGEVLISEFRTVDRLTTGTVTTSEVTTLKHKLRDHAMELGALVAEALLTSAQSTEVLSSLWDNISKELKKMKTER
jgi:hypothetical protein